MPRYGRAGVFELRCGTRSRRCFAPCQLPCLRKHGVIRRAQVCPQREEAGSGAEGRDTGLTCPGLRPSHVYPSYQFQLRQSSTLVDFTDKRLRLVRHASVAVEQLRAQSRLLRMVGFQGITLCDVSRHFLQRPSLIALPDSRLEKILFDFKRFLFPRAIGMNIASRTIRGHAQLRQRGEADLGGAVPCRS